MVNPTAENYDLSNLVLLYKEPQSVLQMIQSWIPEKRKVGRFSYPCIIHSQVCNETHEEKLCIYQEEERPNTRVVSGVIFQCEDVFL